MISGDSKGFDQQCLNQKTGHDLAFLEGGLEIAVKGTEEFLGERQVCFNSKIAAARREALHVLHFHLG